MTKLPFKSIPWKNLKCAKNQLRLDIVLKCGQSFRWSQYEHEPQYWIGVLANRIWLLNQTDDQIQYKTVGNSGGTNLNILNFEQPELRTWRTFA